MAWSILLVNVHLRSRERATASDISFDCFSLRDDILRVERGRGHRRTLLTGDFNLDPFDIGLCDRRAIWGTMDRRLASRRQTHDGVFYNPMWSRQGDDSPGPPGTYSRSSDDHHDYAFHTFDQVLIRPELVPHLEKLEVARQLGDTALVSDADIPRKEVSDHLPLIVELTQGVIDE